MFFENHLWQHRQIEVIVILQVGSFEGSALQAALKVMVELFLTTVNLNWRNYCVVKKLASFKATFASNSENHFRLSYRVVKDLALHSISMTIVRLYHLGRAIKLTAGKGSSHSFRPYCRVSFFTLLRNFIG